MIRNLLFVGIGGFIGSILRYATGIFFTKTITSHFPFGTFAVNIIGCLLIGLFYGWSQDKSWFSAEMGLFLITGICGGFTTFSTFSLDNLSLLKAGAYGLFLLYGVGSFVLGFIAAYGGMVLAKA